MSPRSQLVAVMLLVCTACGGAAPYETVGAETETAGGEQGAGDADAGTAGADPAGPDPTASSLDEPPPGGPTAPSTLVALEGIPSEGVVREEARPEGGVRLVAVLPAALDGNTVFELQTTPGRSGDLAVFAVRALHPAARWAECTTLSLEIDGQTTALTEVRVLTAPAAAEAALETARAAAEVSQARRLTTATSWRILACNESFAPPAATRPTLQRFVARVDELARPAAPRPAGR